eukprot:scaffold94974_cov60-Phaeocystis_antarctica.AAC.6
MPPAGSTSTNTSADSSVVWYSTSWYPPPFRNLGPTATSRCLMTHCVSSRPTVTRGWGLVRASAGIIAGGSPIALHILALSAASVSPGDSLSVSPGDSLM